MARSPSDAKPGCGTPGATVTFKIDGRDVFETVAWSGGFHQLNLTAGDVIWGDNDCSGRLDAGDALRVLRVIIQMQPDPPLCFSLMQRLALRSSSLQVQWGDRLLGRFDAAGRAQDVAGCEHSGHRTGVRLPTAGVGAAGFALGFAIEKGRGKRLALVGS